MANVLDWNALNHKVNLYIDPDNDTDSKQKAFPVLMLINILDISDEEAEDSITDGPKDRGVDAVFVDTRDGKNTIHVFQFKYVNKYEKTKNNFPSNEIDKLSSFFDDALDVNKTMESTCNPILWNKVKEIWDASNKPNPKFELHFCGNMATMTDDEIKRAENTFKKYSGFNLNHHSLDSIIELFIDKKHPIIDDTLTIVDKDYFDRTDGNIRGMICTVEALEIVRLLNDPEYPEHVRTEIFNDNVRIYLSKRNRINKKIIETALSPDNNLFWYFNNGITITCDSFSYLKGRRAPNVEIKNIQIVNGGQTSNALFEAYLQDPEKLEDVLILVRIIETKSMSVSLSIAESTNSQSPINSRDLRSNDDIQKKLEEAFEGLGLFYERKYNQYKDELKSKRVDALSAGQAHLAYGLELPEVAKKDRGRIFSNLYDEVYTDELSAEELLIPFKLYLEIEKSKKTLQKQIRMGEEFDNDILFLLDGTHHVLFAVGQLCDFYEEDRLDFNLAKGKIYDAMSIISKIVIKEEEKDPTFSPSRFFKDSKTKNKIANYIQSLEKEC